MKILVVDDEPDVQPLFLQKFRKEIRNGDIIFHFAFSGEEAMDYLRTHPSEIVLILSDINMPGMSGLELLKNIRLVYAIPPPVIMMITAYSDGESLRQSLEWGADDLLTKPLDFDKLKEKIKIIKN